MVISLLYKAEYRLFYKSLLQKRPMTYIFWSWDIESAYGMERVIEMERYRVNKVTSASLGNPQSVFNMVMGDREW